MRTEGWPVTTPRELDVACDAIDVERSEDWLVNSNCDATAVERSDIALASASAVFEGLLTASALCQLTGCDIVFTYLRRIDFQNQ